jgi:hypothetical protein
MGRSRVTSIVLVAALVPLQLASQTRREARILLRETFDQNDGGWKEQQTSWINTHVRDGKYRFSANVTLQQHVVRDVRLPRTGDFDIELTAETRRGAEDAPFGLVFGYERPSYFFEYLIWMDGRARLQRNAGLDLVELTEAAPTPDLNTGFATNALKIARRGQSLLYYINGKQQGEIPFPWEIGPRIGFVIWNWIEVHFDDVVVTAY